MCAWLPWETRKSNVSFRTAWTSVSLSTGLARKSHHTLFSFHSFLSRNTVGPPVSKTTLISFGSFIAGESREPVQPGYTLFSRWTIHTRSSSESRETLESRWSCKARFSTQSWSVWGPIWSCRAPESCWSRLTVVTLRALEAFQARCAWTTRLAVGITTLSFLSFHSRLPSWPKAVQAWCSRETLLSFQSV